MYVEISGRQTGKTTRLVDHASDELINNINDRNFKIAIVSHSEQSGERIRTMIVERFLDKVNNMVHEDYRNIHDILETNSRGNITRLMDKIVTQQMMEHPMGGYINKFYVDEFSFIDNQNTQTWSLLRLDDNAYYCTTPRPGDEFTLLLKSHCDYNDIEIISYDISQRLRDEFQMTEYVEEFDDWCVDNQIWMMNHPFEESRRLNEKRFIRINKIKRHRF